MNLYLFFPIALLLLFALTSEAKSNRSFVIDYPNNQFLKDGEPFRFISGELHYFRLLRQDWHDRLFKMRMAGINAVATIIEWSLHEPERGVYDFEGDNDLIQFIKTAQKVGLLVLVRPGPFIAGERDKGGFPYWLNRDNPKMKYRSSDPKFLKEVKEWFSVLLPKLKPFLYHNGGPIIMVQSENEFGYVQPCDYPYTKFLKDTILSLMGNETVLFTNDGPYENVLRCAKVKDVLATLDMNPDDDPDKDFALLRRFQPTGPICLSEFYPGRRDMWEHPHSTGGTKWFCDKLDGVLKRNASVNIYTFFGGTSFGFTSGAKYGFANKDYDPFVTSYEHDSPLDESGDPTPKYFAISDVIKKYLPLPEGSLPKPAPKMAFPVTMKPVTSIFNSKFNGNQILSKYPLSFEKLSFFGGFIMYSTIIKTNPSDPAILAIPGLHDRAQVFVDNQYQGTMSRTKKNFRLPINAWDGSQLTIFVENQGRLPWQLNELKGIASNVTLGPVILTNWNHSLFFRNWSKTFADFSEESEKPVANVPHFFKSEFVVPNVTGYPLDTFLRLDGWRKGVAFLNDFNLGRYWPVAGPQITLYAPRHLFKPHPQVNTLVLFELGNSPCTRQPKCGVNFVKQHVVNGTIPYTKTKN